MTRSTSASRNGRRLASQLATRILARERGSFVIFALSLAHVDSTLWPFRPGL